MFLCANFVRVSCPIAVLSLFCSLFTTPSDACFTVSENKQPASVVALTYWRPGNVQGRCLASLIGAQRVLSAVHCVYRERGWLSYVRVWVDGHELLVKPVHNENVFAKESILGRDEISTGMRGEDMVLIKLDRPVQLSNSVQRMPLHCGNAMPNSIKYAQWRGDGICTGKTKTVDCRSALARTTGRAIAELEWHFAFAHLMCSKAVLVEGDSGGPISVAVDGGYAQVAIQSLVKDGALDVFNRVDCDWIERT